MMDHSETEEIEKMPTVIGFIWGLMIKGECWGMRRIFFPFKK